MRFNRLLLVVPFVCFTALLGCGSKCESLCDEAMDEDCKDQFDHGSCVALCVRAEDMKDDTDECSKEFDALMDCASDAEDICDVWDLDDEGKLKKCNTKFNDYAECFTDYCADHDKRDYCGG